MRTFTVVPSFEGKSAYFELPDIGFQGDHLSFAILFNLTELVEHWANIVPSMIITDSKGNTFAAQSTSWDSEKHIFTWNISNYETANSGILRCQLKCVSAENPDTIVCMSQICQTKVYPSLESISGPPDPYQSWIDTLVELGEVVTQNAEEVEEEAGATAANARTAQAAASAAESARDAAVTAKNAAETAQAGAEDILDSVEGIEEIVNAAKADAEDARDDAVTAKTAAETAATNAASARTAAETARDQAVASATNAASSASTANQERLLAEAARAGIEGFVDDAEDAQIAAEAAQTAAETAATNAVTAKTAAEAAQTAAETAATNAVTAKTAAEAAQTTAENAATNAVTAKTAAETAATNAVTAKTAAEAAQTAAESARGTAVSAKTAAEAAQTAAESARDTAVTAKTGAETAQTAAEAAQTTAENAATNAVTAKTAAEAAQTAAETAATNAVTAKTAAETAATNASTAKTAAEAAQTGAETAASNAVTAKTAAEAAQTTAENAATNAVAAKTAAETAQAAAEAAQTGAETAATNAVTAKTAAEAAQTAAETAQTAAETARTGATTAQTRAESAKTAAESARDEILGMSVTASGLSEGSSPTVSYTNGVMAFGIPKGDTGNPGKDFHIAFTFNSVSAMESYSGDIELYDYAMIDTGSVDDPETGRLYCWEDDNQWHYIGDLSGAQGIKGETGNGIYYAVLNNDYTLTINYTNGTSYTTSSIRGERGLQGDNSYTHIRWSANEPTSDSDIKTTPDEWMGIYSGTASTAPTTYTSYTWYKVKGETGRVENTYATTIEMSPSDSTKISEALSDKADKADTVLDTNLSHGKKEGTVVGYGSIAFGYNVKATGDYSQAVGYQTVATLTGSHAEGGKTAVADTTTYNGSTYTYGATGQYAHTEGQNTIANSSASHAEGNATMAIGSSAHAEGENTKATTYCAHAEGTGGSFTLSGTSYTSGAHGTSSHSEGYNTHAGSNGMPGNHAEGYVTVSRGGASHAEGCNTDASGSASHAEGYGGSFTLNGNTYYSGALGQASHSEGYATYAGSYGPPGTHSEGNSTVSRGGASHSEGYNTEASGLASHAEGTKTIAGGNYSHAEGMGSQSSGVSSHAEGDGTYAVGRASHVVGRYNYTDSGYESFSGWVSGRSYAVGDMVIRTSTLYVCKTANSDTTFTSSKWDNMASSGEYRKFVEIVGNGNSQIKSNARAVDWEGNEYLMGDLYVGCDSQSANGTKVAKAVNPEFTGTFSHNRKASTTVGANSVAIGNNVTASGNSSFAEGNSTTASGDISHAEGNSTTASGNYSHAEGYGTTSSGYYSHAEGIHTNANGAYSHAEGNSTSTTGESAHAEGHNTQAVGNYSHAEGYTAKANGSISHAEGNGTQANGDRSHAEGDYTVAGGQYSHSEGGYTKASGNTSHAEGYSTISYGGTSHAEGTNTIAYGDYSHAEGGYTKATGNYSHAGGKYNVGDFDTWPTWTAGTSYEVGDKVKRVTTNSSGLTITTGYVCKTANSSQTFVSSEWTQSYGVYAEVIGNGTSGTNSNARALDWEGNEYLNGDLYVGCNGNSTGGTKVAKITDIKDAVNQYDDETEFPATGDEDALYISKDTSQIFRWDETAVEYVAISSAGGETLHKVTFSIATTDWTATTGGYSASITDENIAVNSEEIVIYDDSIGNLTSNIGYTKSTGSITFFVESVPSGAVGGRILIIGESIAYDRKLNKNQGAANAGKVMKVGSTGELTPEDLPESVGVIYETQENQRIASFSDGADNLPVKTLTVGIEPVQDLHGYENPWPAGGGTNKCPEQWEPGMYNVTTGEKKNGTNYIRSTTMFPVLPETSYCYVKPSGNATRILFYDSNGDFISSPDLIYTNHTSDVFTTPQGAYFMTTYTAEASYNNDVAINYPSTISTYSPYSNICPISGWTGANVSVAPTSDPDDPGKVVYSYTFPSEAGTVYGGTLTVNKDGTGTLVVDRVAKAISEFSWTKSETVEGYFSTSSALDKGAYNAGMIAEAYKTVPVGTQSADMPNGSIAGVNAASSQYTSRIRIRDTTGYETADAFVTAMGSYKISYLLATPVTYTFTASQIKTLLGINNVWADTGNVLQIDYSADTKLYVDLNIETVLDDYVYDEVKNQATWAVGNWSGADGTAGNNNKRIRTQSTSNIGLDYVIESENGVLFSVYFWSSTAYLGYTGTNNWLQKLDVQKFIKDNYATFGTAKKIRVVARTDPEQVMTDIVTQTAAKIHFYKPVSNLTQDMIAGSDYPTATTSHAQGEIFICNNKLYKATQAIASGETITVGTNVTATTVAAELAALPAVTSADNGKILTVVNGIWAATTMAAWQGGSY